jgi:hypothetical protein
MKVAEAPITLLADDAQREITILAAGFRIVMTGEEAGSFWAELGRALKKIYADDAERCPAALSALLHRDGSAGPEKPAGESQAPAERLLEGIIAYAHRSGAWADGPPGPQPSIGRSHAEPPQPSSGMLGRAIGKLTRR